jgi:hypothetical protein
MSQENIAKHSVILLLYLEVLHNYSYDMIIKIVAIDNCLHHSILKSIYGHN